jgi:hypothetical protein
MTESRNNQIKCRLIEDADREGVVDCLTRGFPWRRRSYWVAALVRLERRPTIADCPKYGFLLESQGRVVGVLLQIFSRRGEAGRSSIFCNLSSWCLDRDFRAFAAMLNAKATSRREVTYVNVSASPHTWKGIEALGFQRYCDGHFLCAPALSFVGEKAHVAAFSADSREAALLSAHEREVLAEHESLGCRSLVVVAGGAAYPFVFAPRRLVRLIPCQQLIYCRDMSDFSRFAGPIGRHLLARGWLLCLADANGPLAGLVGRYVLSRGSKYFKGPETPNLGDLTFTEFAFFGR